MARHLDGALVLFSGASGFGRLVWALAQFDWVETVGFDYGQRHRVELDCLDAFRAALMDRFPDWGFIWVPTTCSMQV
jgi:7-cyano-7-deazaguanine synthase